MKHDAASLEIIKDETPLHERFYAAPGVQTWTIRAAIEGNLRLFKWCLKQHSVCEKHMKIITREAACRGHLHILQAAEKRNILSPKYACDSAARCGHLHVLKWLIGKEYLLTIQASMWAAASGHLAVLLWLYDIRHPFHERTFSLPSLANADQRNDENRKRQLEVARWALEMGYPGVSEVAIFLLSQPVRLNSSKSQC